MNQVTREIINSKEIIIDPQMARAIQLALKDSIIKTQSQTLRMKDPDKIEFNNSWVESLAKIYNYLEEEIYE